MSGKHFPGQKGGWWVWWACAGVVMVSWLANGARAQTAPSSLPPLADAPAAVAAGDGAVVPAGCAACGGGGRVGELFGGGCASCGGGNCIPGRDPAFCCCGWGGDCALGHFLSGVYQCICCPDPCYEPKWTPVADSAFFVDAARPITQMRIRYEHGFGLLDPDRSEFFMAKDHTNPLQLGPAGHCAPANNPGKGMDCIASKVDSDVLQLYMEGATARAGVFVAVPYESLDFTTAGISPTTCCHESGFGDIVVGAKTLILDCQLLQLTTEFTTYIPSGNFTKSLGTGHVSLEPAILLAICLTPDCYIQSQFSYWIPLGGDPLYDANIFHQHASLNCVLCCPCPGLQVVGTFEMNNWWILGGAYTSTSFLSPNPSNGTLSPVAISSSGADIFSTGPGVRLFICDKIDFGVGCAIAVTGDKWQREVLRTEFRWRF
jgi:hypothetical protein